MRIANFRLWLPVLALLVVGCGPWHRRPHCGMAMGCTPDSCRYRSECFSDGAVRSNDGVCQSCSGGKWVAASGCREGACPDSCGKKGKGKGAPCEHGPHHGCPHH